MDDTKNETVVSSVCTIGMDNIKKAKLNLKDVGADLYLEVQDYSDEELEAERKTVLRKIDWVIMPLVRDM
jgi:hypothetical protein